MKQYRIVVRTRNHEQSFVRPYGEGRVIMPADAMELLELADAMELLELADAMELLDGLLLLEGTRDLGGCSITFKTEEKLDGKHET